MILLPITSAVTLALMSQTPAIVELPGRDIRIEHLANVATGGDRVIGRIPEGQLEVEFDEATARRLIRNRIPHASFELSFEGQVRLTVNGETAHDGFCFAAAKAIPAGTAISHSVVTPVECSADVIDPGLGFDRLSERPVARAPIEAGAFLGTVQPTTDRGIARGQQAILVTGGDGVAIERTVTTMQHGDPDGRVFVRTQDSAVFVVPTNRLQTQEEAQ